MVLGKKSAFQAIFAFKVGGIEGYCSKRVIPVAITRDLGRPRRRRSESDIEPRRSRLDYDMRTISWI